MLKGETRLAHLPGLTTYFAREAPVSAGRSLILTETWSLMAAYFHRISLIPALPSLAGLRGIQVVCKPIYGPAAEMGVACIMWLMVGKPIYGPAAEMGVACIMW